MPEGQLTFDQTVPGSLSPALHHWLLFVVTSHSGPLELQTRDTDIYPTAVKEPSTSNFHKKKKKVFKLIIIITAGNAVSHLCNGQMIEQHKKKTRNLSNIVSTEYDIKPQVSKPLPAHEQNHLHAALYDIVTRKLQYLKTVRSFWVINDCKCMNVKHNCLSSPVFR